MRDSTRLTILVAITTALHILAAITAPMLAGEAYYWLWGKHLAAGYFDHPPMVGLLAFLSFGWINGSPLAARSSSIILSAILPLVIYALARSMYPDGKTPWRCALLFSIVPLFHAGGVMIQPDTGLIFFASLTWLCFWRAYSAGRTPVWWCLSGVCAGLTLLCKFHAWVLLPPLYLFLLLTPKGREVLKTPWPWIAIVIAIIVLSPNLIWNARRDWINYTYQWRRSDLPKSHFEIENVLIYLLGPALSLTPLVYWLLLRGAGRGFRLWLRERDDRALFLLCAGLPLPVFLGILSFAVTISLHWPSSGYIPLLILGIALVERDALVGPRVWRATIWVCVGAVALAHLAIQFINYIPAGIRSPVWGDMVNSDRLKAEWTGWPEIGKTARELLDEANESNKTVLMAPDWHLASSIAFYSERPEQCFAFVDFDAHNFKMWMNEEGGIKNVDAIVFFQKSDPYKQHSRPGKKYDKYLRELDPLFHGVKPLPSLILYADGSAERYWGVDVTRPRYREMLIFHGSRFRGNLIE